MPQPITADDCAAMHDQFRDARLIVANEFRGLDTHDQYYNAFARLLKRDPLERVAMLGTDQRDQFVPVLRRLIAEGGDAPRRILDVGCGDGQTFALIADTVPEGSTIDLVDPNADYVRAYADRVAAMPNITLGAAHALPFVPDSDDSFYNPALDRGYDLILAIHALYFFADLDACLADLGARLAPGGTAIIVFADESVSYTGLGYRAFLRSRGEDALAQAHADLCQQRLTLLRGSAGAPPAVAARWQGDVRVHPQPTRLYGHSLSDLIALGNIAGLSLFETISKFEVIADQLEYAPMDADLRIETDAGPRQGMLSVTQPQIVCAVTKPF
ncbi:MULTISPECIES: bifunctional 2-polyprenyl-6-hydroxyphenol methylase/3-demethylubiquinol 3-O-methyltransferase UbiG [unclassified Sphingomonas]|uniref:class I SAM-dependent methyltransferase n=1 Tax=unclassified Sphingomonas TaxID=196159 RepID=UPI002151CFBB|nr:MULTISPECIES: class I SAM-dependent methyltransferase [unclassified Sphingomonas]MCR5871353.1 class I SAM-dependent methyltransferase [Sphingomonas sp. J344]UUY00344.1 class I SAM-dependent methyltransferase [Sphingomonas sp. J315]